jgi:hypothetical protein
MPKTNPTKKTTTKTKVKIAFAFFASFSAFSFALY